MDWKQQIHSDPKVLGGKLTFKGTRYSVERVLKLVGAGWTNEQIAEEYPGIGPEHIQAAAQFAADLIHDEDFVAIAKARAA
ncbi:MAG: DUF433 domain-containing protein [Novosphingobium sp.]